MNTPALPNAASPPAPRGNSGSLRNCGGRAGRKGGWAKTGLPAVLAALAFFIAGQVRADSYADFNRAIATADVTTVTRLLERGMDPNTVNEQGEPALLTAAREGSAAIVKALLRARVKVNVKNEHGDTAIMLAALGGDLAVVKLLREAGAEINHPGWTPLQYAAINGHDAVIEYLLSSGADLALVAPNGVTPLMLAVHANKPDTVKLLIGYGFDVGARNDRGETALAWARRREYKDIEQMLRRAGAKE
jgi:ankyrin repeat protein